MENLYMVYGKHREMRTFKAMDMKDSSFVGNLINASIFTPEELPKLKKEIEYMNKHNPHYKFEIRKK